jgi:hypothetical protein
VVRSTISLLENQCGQKLRAVRTDRGGEYLGRELQGWFASKGVQHQLTTPYTPEQNGVAERLNRTLVERVRAMLQGAGLMNRKDLWAEAVVTANYLRNRSLTSKETLTPWERFTGKRPDVSGLRVFGARAFVHIPAQLRRKLDSVSQPGIMIGYAANSKAYRILLDSGRVVESRDVVFAEQYAPRSEGKPSSATGSGEQDSDSDEETQRPAGQPTGPRVAEAAQPLQRGQRDGEGARPAAGQEQPAAEPARRFERTESEEAVGAARGLPRVRAEQNATAPQARPYPDRARRSPGQWYVSNLASVRESEEPTSVEDALSRPDSRALATGHGRGDGVSHRERDVVTS